MRLVLVPLLAAAALVPGSAAAPTATPPLGVLLARHVPILVLHPAERLRPVSVDGFLADSDLLRKTEAGWEKVDGPLPAGGADLRLDQRVCRAREGPVATTCYASAQGAHGSALVVYGAAFRRRNRIELQYWLWYPFNPYSPTVPAGEVWEAHEGDWEAVSVILDLQGKPLLVGLSRHEEGARREWTKVPKRGLRPLVYVALGSHANYFGPGAHRLDPRTTPKELISVIESLGVRPLDHTGPGGVVRPKLVPVTSSTPTWMAFAGAWGEDRYIHAPNSEPLAFGAGPRGPAFHEQWRAPVTEVLSWPRG